MGDSARVARVAPVASAVVGDLPVRFLKSSRRNATKTLAKAALKLRAPEGMDEDTTVAEFTKAANIEVIDLRVLLPRLR